MTSLSALLISAGLLFSNVASADDRPEGMTIGIGGGVAIPAEPFAINAASVRFRLNESLTVEPIAYYNRATTGSSSKSTFEEQYTEDWGGEETTTEEESEDSASVNSYEANLLVRYRVAKRGKADLEALIGAGYSGSSSKDEPDEDEEGGATTTLKSSSIGLVWGVGTEFYFHPHFSVSADALNLIAFTTKSSTKVVADGAEDFDGDGEDDYTYNSVSNSTATTKNFDIGWDPSVRFMVHMYF